MRCPWVHSSLDTEVTRLDTGVNRLVTSGNSYGGSELALQSKFQHGSCQVLPAFLPLRALEYALTLDNMQSLGSVTWVIGDSQKRLCQTGTLYQVFGTRGWHSGSTQNSSYLAQEDVAGHIWKLIVKQV